jgi:hypothetical protein
VPPLLKFEHLERAQGNKEPDGEQGQTAERVPTLPAKTIHKKPVWRIALKDYQITPTDAVSMRCLVAGADPQFTSGVRTCASCDYDHRSRDGKNCAPTRLLIVLIF